MTIIVTGGAGFIGANFIFYMLETRPDDRIVCVDKLTYAGSLATLKAVKGDHYQFVHPTKKGKVTVPHPKKDIPINTLRNIEKQAGLKFTR